MKRRKQIETLMKFEQDVDVSVDFSFLEKITTFEWKLFFFFFGVPHLLPVFFLFSTMNQNWVQESIMAWL